MRPIPYDASRKSLYRPGDADDFFPDGSIQSDAALCAEMSRLAYVEEENRLETYLGRIGFRKDSTIGYKEKGTQLFIASKNDGSLTVVAFRGTQSDDPTDLFTDAKFSLVRWSDETGRPLGQVHKGFADALKNNDILKQVAGRRKSMATRVLLTGHSLGAALATLAASWMPSAHLYTFGSPRVGDATFAQAMQAVNHYRYVDCCDLVTQVPPEEVFQYVHSGALRYIDRHGKLLDSPDEAAIDADRVRAHASYVIHYAFFPNTVVTRDLADHSPINYVSGVLGIRGG